MKPLLTGFARAVITVSLFFGAAEFCEAQGTLSVTFDAWSPAFARTQNYLEQGLWLRVTNPSSSPTSFVSQQPYTGVNDTPYMYYYATTNLPSDHVSITLDSGEAFGLISVDLANRFATYTSVLFQGYRADGSVVAQQWTWGTFAGWGTYSFGSEFTDLKSVDVLGPRWMLDNLVFSIPEPSTWTLLAAGTALFFFYGPRKRKRMAYQGRRSGQPPRFSARRRAAVRERLFRSVFCNRDA